MRVHVLQHVAFEGLGSIESWLDAAQAQVSFTRFFAHDPLPAIPDIDMLIVLGGPMSVHDQIDYPWLVDEKIFIQQAIAARKPILGVCLGAQLISYSLGASVEMNKQKEIGWFDIEAIPPVSQEQFQFPATLKVFHWHGETFSLPAKAVHLARSAACENQAYQYSDHIIALQFHLETTMDTASQIVEHCGHELVEGRPFIQSGAEILRQTPDASQPVNALMVSILNYLKLAIPR